MTCFPSIGSCDPLAPSASGLSLKQDPFPDNKSENSLNKERERKKTEEINKSTQTVPSDFDDVLVSTSQTASSANCDSSILTLSEQALAAIFVIPRVHANAFLNEAAALKFQAELVASESDEQGNALIILGREENACQAFLSMAMLGKTINNPNPSRKIRSQGRSSKLRAAAAAVAVGVVGTWAALAFV